MFRVFLSRAEDRRQSSSDTSKMHDDLVVGLYGSMLNVFVFQGANLQMVTVYSKCKCTSTIPVYLNE